MNHFDQLVDDIALPCYINLSRDHEPNLWFDGDRFIHYLCSFSQVDIATYSYSDFGCKVRINRLITGLKLTRSSKVKPLKHKYVQNNHSKIFICYKTTKITRRPKRVTIDSVFIGSQNLTSGTNFNLMYKVNKQHEAPIVNFFEQMWREK